MVAVVMFWETLTAIFLLLAALPLWLFAAWAWGVILFLFWIVAGSVDAFTSPHAGLEQILLVPLAAILSAFNGAWSVPVWIWTWAKFDHPWWAFFIALFLSVIFGRRR